VLARARHNGVAGADCGKVAVVTRGSSLLHLLITAEAAGICWPTAPIVGAPLLSRPRYALGMATSEERALAKADAKNAKALARQQRVDSREQAAADKQAELEETMRRVGPLVRKDFRIGFSLHIFENEVWIGSPASRGSRGWSLAGAQATTVINGQITQRLTATRMVTLGVFALAAPKKTGNQTLALKVSGPGYNFTYQHQGDVNRAAIQRFDALADTINTLSQRVTPQSPSEPGTGSVADELTKFVTLRDQGVLTEEEFATKKAQLLR
jgi:hypothetical protein